MTIHSHEKEINGNYGKHDIGPAEKVQTPTGDEEKSISQNGPEGEATDNASRPSGFKV